MLTIKHRFTTYTVHSITRNALCDRMLAIACANDAPVPVGILEVTAWHYGDLTVQPVVSISAITLISHEAEAIFNLTRKEATRCV